jgi:hypothetical protein
VCFVPLREIESHVLPPPVTASQHATQRLEELLAAVEKAEALADEEEQTLSEEIHKLVEETRRTPLTHEKWEAVDALEQQMLQALEKAGLQADKLAAATELLAAAAAGEGPPLSDEQLLELEQELLDALQTEAGAEQSGAAGAGKAGLNQLLKKLSQAGKGGPKLPRDPQARRELLAELQEHLAEEQKLLAELRKQCQGACKPGQCSQCQRMCEGEGELCQQCQGGLNASQAASAKPGRGGISRGRGDAELTWGREADEQGIKFKETVLPPGALEDPGDQVVGIRLTAPKVDPAAAAERGPARDIAPATGRETWTRQLRPRHKEVVRQFFDPEQ